MKDVKIVIGANYGDEGKGLVTRYFCSQAEGSKIVIFHNGTAQRGHTIDYDNIKRHVYHHFCSGTAEGVITYFATTFWVHPMKYYQEYVELRRQGIQAPRSYCSKYARIITPFDMIADQATEEWIALQCGQREFGSCAFGTWCATDRVAKFDDIFTFAQIVDLLGRTINVEQVKFYLIKAWEECLKILDSRGVIIEKTSYSSYFDKGSSYWTRLIDHFIFDLKFFVERSVFIELNEIIDIFDSLIFENGQGLGLDQRVNNEWTTTSDTGSRTVGALLSLENSNVNVEACYVTRPYLTRHGQGPLEEEAFEQAQLLTKDRTNQPNIFQGNLRFGYFDKEAFNSRIAKDLKELQRYCPQAQSTIAVTHWNELDQVGGTKLTSINYISDNPFSVTRSENY